MTVTPSEVTKVFADRFSDLQFESGETIKEQSRKIGLSTGALSKYGSAQQEPGATALSKIARHYNVSVDYLLGLSETKNPSPDIQGARKLTGLSELAIMNIAFAFSPFVDVLDAILESGEFLKALEKMISAMEIAPLINLPMPEEDEEEARRAMLVGWTSKKYVTLEGEAALESYIQSATHSMEKIFRGLIKTEEKKDGKR